MKIDSKQLTASFIIFILFSCCFLGAATKEPSQPVKNKNVTTKQTPVQERVKKTNDEEKNVIRDTDSDEDDAFLAHRGEALPEETFNLVSSEDNEDIDDFD